MNLKEIETLYQEMLASFGAQTGLQPEPGCDLSARMYALAAQIYALYVQADWVSRQSFPQTAQGEYLERHAQLRGFVRKQPVAAKGVVRFTAGEYADTQRIIPAGTVCMTAGLVRFETTQQAVLPPDALTVDVPVQALTPGTAGNVQAGTIVSMAVAPLGIASCTNPEACGGGMNLEEDEALRQRVLASFRRLPNGANAAFYQQEALSFDPVAAAQVISRPRGTGTVDVVVATQHGLPEQALLDALHAHFQQRREIAVDVQVRRPETVSVELSVAIAPKQGYEPEGVIQQVKTAIQGWFNGKLLGQGVLLAQLGDLIYHCEGVDNYSIATPAADLPAQADVLPVLGSLTVEGMP